MKKLILLAALATAAAAPTSPVTALAGRYSNYFPDPFTGKPVDSVVEIVPLDNGHAYINFDIEFANGFSCGVKGLATARGDALVYRAPAVDPDTGKRCMLTIRRDGNDLAFSDGDGSCKYRCGMNGDLTDGALDWRSRRPISYMAKLKKSSAYLAAVAQWRSETRGGRR